MTSAGRGSRPAIPAILRKRFVVLVGAAVALVVLGAGLRVRSQVEPAVQVPGAGTASSVEPVHAGPDPMPDEGDPPLEDAGTGSWELSVFGVVVAWSDPVPVAGGPIGGGDGPPAIAAPYDVPEFTLAGKPLAEARALLLGSCLDVGRNAGHPDRVAACRAEVVAAFDRDWPDWAATKRCFGEGSSPDTILTTEPFAGECPQDPRYAGPDPQTVTPVGPTVPRTGPPPPPTTTTTGPTPSTTVPPTRKPSPNDRETSSSEPTSTRFTTSTAATPSPPSS